MLHTADKPSLYNPMDSPLISTHSLVPEVSPYECVCVGPPNLDSFILQSGSRDVICQA